MTGIRMEYPIRDFVPFEGYTRHLSRSTDFWNEHRKAIKSDEVTYNWHREDIRKGLFTIYHAVASTAIIGGVIGLMQALR